MEKQSDELKVFGKSKADIKLILDSISSHTDKNHPSNDEGYNSLKLLEEGMELLSKNNEAKNTFGVNLNV